MSNIVELQTKLCKKCAKSTAKQMSCAKAPPSPISLKPQTFPKPQPCLLAASTLAPVEISFSTTAVWPFTAARCSAVLPRHRHGSRRDTQSLVPQDGIIIRQKQGLVALEVNLVHHFVALQQGHALKNCPLETHARHCKTLLWGRGPRHWSPPQRHRTSAAARPP